MCEINSAWIQLLVHFDHWIVCTHWWQRWHQAAGGCWGTGWAKVGATAAVLCLVKTKALESLCKQPSLCVGTAHLRESVVGFVLCLFVVVCVYFSVVLKILNPNHLRSEQKCSIVQVTKHIASALKLFVLFFRLIQYGSVWFYLAFLIK